MSKQNEEFLELLSKSHLPEEMVKLISHLGEEEQEERALKTASIFSALFRKYLRFEQAIFNQRWAKKKVIEIKSQVECARIDGRDKVEVPILVDRKQIIHENWQNKQLTRRNFHFLFNNQVPNLKGSLFSCLSHGKRSPFMVSPRPTSWGLVVDELLNQDLRLTVYHNVYHNFTNLGEDWRLVINI